MARGNRGSSLQDLRYSSAVGQLGSGSSSQPGSPRTVRSHSEPNAIHGLSTTKKSLFHSLANLFSKSKSSASLLEKDHGKGAAHHSNQKRTQGPSAKPPLRRGKSAMAKIEGIPDSPLDQEFSRPLTFEKPQQFFQQQGDTVEFKQLPQSLELNLSGIAVFVTDPDAFRRENGLLAQYNSRRKLSTIQSIDIELSDDRSSSIRQSFSASSFSSFTDDDEPQAKATPKVEEPKKRGYVFNNPEITNELVDKKLELLDRQLRGIAPSSETIPPPSLAVEVEKAPPIEKPPEEKKFVKPELLTTSSSSRLEVPSKEPRRRSSNESDGSFRRPSTSSTSSSSLTSRPSSQEIEVTIESKEVRDLKDSSKESKIKKALPRESSKTLLVSPVIVEQPEPHESHVPVEQFEPRRVSTWKKRTSLRSKKSTDSEISGGHTPVPVVFIDSGDTKAAGVMTLGRKALRKRNAAQHAKLRRSKSDPGLGGMKDSSQSSFVLGGLKRSLSQTMIPRSQTAESLFENQLETKIKETARQATQLMEKECKRMFESFGISMKGDLEEELAKGVIMFQLYDAIRKQPSHATFNTNPVNIYQKQDNVASFLTLLQTSSNVPSSRCFALSDIFSEPKYIAKVYSCLLSLKKYLV